MKIDDDLFDFGFTTVTVDELTEVKQKESDAKSTQCKLDKMHRAIKPLLQNLKANPDKDYILWPDRLKKVEEFEMHLEAIYNGDR